MTHDAPASTTRAAGLASPPPAPPDLRLGHVHLRVSDLDRATAFYRDALGLRLVADGRAVGLPIAFLAAGDYHHHVALNAQETPGGTPPPPGHTGLHHVAFLVPDRAALAAATRRLAAHGCPPVSGWDHGATVSVYVRDPDGHTIELYFDRARAHWYDAHGRPVLRAERFDPRELLGEPPGAA